jgi:DHA1 family multidrug resistance protein-like MFS transporter
MSADAGIRAIVSDRAVTAVVAVAFVLMLGAGIVLPILPLFARSFGVGYSETGILVSAYGAARLVIDLAAGAAVDRWGERACAAAGLAAVAVSSFLTGLAPVFALAVAFWAGAGAGSALVFAALYSHLLRVVPQARMARTLSVFYGAFNGGFVVGSFLAGVVASALGLAAPLFVSAALALAAAGLYLRFVPLPAKRAEPLELTAEEVMLERDVAAPRGVRAGIADLLRTPGFVTVIITNLAYLWIIAAVLDTLVPLFAKDELGMSPEGIGVVFALALATEFAILYPAGALADRRGRKLILVPALAALAVVCAALGWAASPFVLGALMALSGFAFGFAGVPPAAMLADVVPEERSGTGVGIFRFSGDLGFTLGPLVAGYTATAFGFEIAFAIAVAPAVVALLLAVRTQETLKSARAGSRSA